MANERAKHIEFDYEGEHYELFYTKATVKRLEQSGFTREDITEKPINGVMALFEGAFWADPNLKHRQMKRSEIEKIYTLLRKGSSKKGADGENETLVGRLLELFNQPYKDLLEDDEDDESLIVWN